MGWVCRWSRNVTQHLKTPLSRPDAAAELVAAAFALPAQHEVLHFTSSRNRWGSSRSFGVDKPVRWPDDKWQVADRRCSASDRWRGSTYGMEGRPIRTSA